MLLANHVENNLVIQFPANSKECWVQNKRVREDLNRLNHNKEVQLVYPPIFNAAQEAQVRQVISSTFPSSIVISLISSATMEVGTVQQPPTQVATSRIPKSKYRKPTSSASQKAPVVKTTQTLEGSVKEVVSAEGMGDHQRNPKNKDGEISVSQPSHPVSSQKDTVVENEFFTSLVASSQKDVAIENSPQPGTHHKRDKDTRSPTDTTKAYERRKRSKTSAVAQGSHTVSMAPSQILFDVAPVNVESQPHSLTIQTKTKILSSPTLSLDVDMIHTSIHDSPSLTFLEKPHSGIGGHHLIDDLLDHQSIISKTLAPSVALNLKSISTDSTIVSISKATSFSSSMDISHPLMSVCLSTDMPQISYPLTYTSTISTNTPSTLALQTSNITTSSVDELVVVQTLLGLREGSEATESERLVCNQAKGEGEKEGKTISSSLVKVSYESSTLVARAKEAIKNVPPGACEDFDYDEDNDDSESGEGGDEGPSTLQEMPSWLFSNSYIHNDTKVVILKNYQRAHGEAQTSNPLHATTDQIFVASLQLHQAHILQQRANIDDIKGHLDGVKDALERRVDVVAPSTSQRCKQDKLVKDVDALTKRMDKMEKQMDTFLANQNLQTQLMQQLLYATSVTQTLDDNKKGENALVVSETVTKGVPSSQGEPPQIIANPSEFQLTKVISPQAKDVQVFLNSERLIKESIFKAVTSSSTSSVPIHTTILKVLTPDTIILQKEYDAEHSSVKEFEPIFSGRTGSPPRHHGKNKLEVDYPFPKPDESKVLATFIRNLKNTNDIMLRQGLAVIYRNGKEIHITNSHLGFNEAKVEEISRVRREANPHGFESTPEKQARLAQELMREMVEESSEAVEEEAPTKSKLKKRKTIPKAKPTRWKQRSHRPVSPERVEEKRDTGRRIVFEDPIPASTQSQTTFHETLVEPKEEPVEFDNLVFSKFIIKAEKKSKKREQVKRAQQGPIKLNVAPKVVKPVENKADFLYIVEI
ncbi:hypothetical protein POM88_012899 [Heracleum sosnowskyi]|uniref:Uncharacterized protein n=1 Tax=Heracleum sosnowskyi TaxID=360622 RepID=A0AAD8N3U7_9APIA|nr:hypothetical protein POM88_012899 [Heracleum sosnowskyi]